MRCYRKEDGCVDGDGWQGRGGRRLLDRMGGKEEGGVGENRGR